MNLYQPDKIITAADLESLALEYLRPLPIPGVEGRTLDPDNAWATVLHAAVEQTSIHVAISHLCCLLAIYTL